ncbi:MAG: molybdopterin-dependent oxidoreductase [Dehalococcoidia bacterium]|nr:molybdopterin-dependent oxidoreductase [Dehalococcoidia bacterium]
MSSQRHAAHASTIVTMQLGVCLAVLLGLMFFSGGLFYLYTFNYDIGPYFTITRFIHFYAGLASIPFLLAKYGSTGYRFAGYYLRVPRFKKAGPPGLIPRILSPLLALDFFVLYCSGLYMLFHYYYTVANISPAEIKPVQLHLWASILAVPLLAAHLGSHLVDTARGLARERRELLAQQPLSSESARRVITRRAFVGTVLAGGLGLAIGFQNTPLVHKEFAGLFIGRIPREERGGPGDFPVETLFGKRTVDVAAWRLRIDGAVEREIGLTYAELLALPIATKRIRISCVSGWSSQPTWSGPRVRDVLEMAGADPMAKGVDFHSVSGYAFGWHRHRLVGDDAILATHVNGAPLSDNHGFPVRLIVPGYPGQNMVKQLDRITVRAEKEKFNPDFHLTSLAGSDNACARSAAAEA